MKFFKLFASCILTKGVRRTLICDTQRHQLYFIPNDFYDILEHLKIKPLEQILKLLDDEGKKIFNKYLSYFLENELGFYCDNPESFPDLKLEFDTPELVNNAIIEINDSSNYNVKKVISELSTLRCKFLEIRYYDVIDIGRVEETVANCLDGFFRNIDLYIHYSDQSAFYKSLVDLKERNQIIGSIIVHSCDSEMNIDNIIATKKIIKNNRCCGEISKSFFSLDIQTIAESKLYNNCLNKKISIDVHGNIKNCPSTNEVYGNIQDISLNDALSNYGFKKAWGINKDKIKICRDCEFRYICTDCRAYLENPKDILSKPLKCGYDPYTNEWMEWNTVRSKYKAIKYYKL